MVEVEVLCSTTASPSLISSCIPSYGTALCTVLDSMVDQLVLEELVRQKFSKLGQKIFDKLRSFLEKPLDLGVKLKNYQVKKAAALTPQMLQASCQQIAK